MGPPIPFFLSSLTTFYTVKERGESHRIHCDLWFKCYNPKLTFSTIIREYEKRVNSQSFFFKIFEVVEVELAIKTDENDIFIVLCCYFNDTRFFSRCFAVRCFLMIHGHF